VVLCTAQSRVQYAICFRTLRQTKLCNVLKAHNAYLPRENVSRKGEKLQTKIDVMKKSGLTMESRAAKTTQVGPTTQFGGVEELKVVLEYMFYPHAVGDHQARWKTQALIMREV